MSATAHADLTRRRRSTSVTAGLIDPGVVHDLPRYTAWDHSERARLVGPLSASFPGPRRRRANGERTLAAAVGGHAALYLMGDGPRGISLELVSMAPTERIVRLTRCVSGTRSISPKVDHFSGSMNEVRKRKRRCNIGGSRIARVRQEPG
jgi:hypothetical protein